MASQRITCYIASIVSWVQLLNDIVQVSVLTGRANGKNFFSERSAVLVMSWTISTSSCNSVLASSHCPKSETLGHIFGSALREALYTTVRLLLCDDNETK